MGSVVNQVTLRKGLKALFIKAWNNSEMPNDVMPFIMETTSDGADEEYGWLGASPEMSEWIDERKVKALNEFDYLIPNKSYEATIGVSRDSIEDDRLGAVQMRINEMARKARTHPRKLFFEALLAGTTDLCYDGQPFFSASHSEGSSGTQTNLYTGTGVTLAQIQADLEGAEARMLNYKDDIGAPVNEGNIQLAVICPPALKVKFEQLNSLAFISQTDNFWKNKISKIVSTARLTDANDWYLADISSGLKPIVMQKRREVEFTQLEENSEKGFMSKKFHYGVDYRVGFGYGLWQKMIKVTNT